jgi:hypothetical protein
MTRFFAKGLRAPPAQDSGQPDPWLDADEAGEPSDDHVDRDPGDDNGWRWVAAVAGAVLLIAVVGIMVILDGGHRATTAGKVAPPVGPTRVTPPPPPPATTSQPSDTLSPSASPSSETSPEIGPTVGAAPAVDTRTIVYTVWGTRRSIDPVTVVYSDERGAFHTDFNVTLPWSKIITLDANVTRESVTATSVASQLNCTISDESGATIASQNHNAIATTCNG